MPVLTPEKGSNILCARGGVGGGGGGGQLHALSAGGVALSLSEMGTHVRLLHQHVFLFQLAGAGPDAS